MTREDHALDSCRCYLIDENGKSYDYCPRLHALGFVDLLWDDHNIFALSDEEVESTYGKDKMVSMYQAAKTQLEKMSDYFSKYRVEKINVDTMLGDKEVVATLTNP